MLGVPLNSQAESLFGSLDSLYRAVLGNCRQKKTVPDFIHRLMVEAVDGKLVFTYKLAKKGAFGNRNTVRGLFTGKLLPVSVYMEFKRSATGYVKYLYAAADCENGKVSFIGEPCQLKLVFIPLRGGLEKPCRIVIGNAAEAGRNVAATA